MKEISIIYWYRALGWREWMRVWCRHMRLEMLISWDWASSLFIFRLCSIFSSCIQKEMITLLSIIELFNILKPKKKSLRENTFLRIWLVDSWHWRKRRKMFIVRSRLLHLGFLRTAPGTAARIVKNLRICGDC